MKLDFETTILVCILLLILVIHTKFPITGIFQRTTVCLSALMFILIIFEQYQTIPKSRITDETFQQHEDFTDEYLQQNVARMQRRFNPKNRSIRLILNLGEHPVIKYPFLFI